jgi:predicted phosphodiesterase
MCEVVERHERGWLAVHGQCVEAANVEPHAVALLAVQEAVELVIAGHTIEEDS